jgi:hypothetical protein
MLNLNENTDFFEKLLNLGASHGVPQCHFGLADVFNNDPARVEDLLCELHER